MEKYIVGKRSMECKQKQLGGLVRNKIKHHNHVCPVTTLTHVTYILLSHICVIYMEGLNKYFYWNITFKIDRI
jgi:hypothetical protein